ncbi:hydroxypyruvate isomerase family protein [Roseivivax sp. CAU 1761]
MRFSANLGFLWTDRPLPDAIRAAHRAGFDAVECHWPYAEPVEAVRAALQETGLPMLGLNTARGDAAGGENGLTALPGRKVEAREAIDAALDYAAQIGAAHVHVMAGVAAGPAAHAAYVENLTYASGRARAAGRTILIEPLNPRDAPGYYLQSAEQAAELIAEIGAPNLRMMFDCYHIQILSGDLTRRLRRFLPLTGHVQIAAVPDRGAPDHGEVDYRHVMRTLRDLGWQAPVGAEYRPDGPTEDSLGWLPVLRQA